MGRRCRRPADERDVSSLLLGEALRMSITERWLHRGRGRAVFDVAAGPACDILSALLVLMSSAGGATRMMAQEAHSVGVTVSLMAGPVRRDVRDYVAANQWGVAGGAMIESGASVGNVLTLSARVSHFFDAILVLQPLALKSRSRTNCFATFCVARSVESRQSERERAPHRHNGRCRNAPIL
jgi:hypothetical protein